MSDWEKVGMETGPTWDYVNDKEIEGVLVAKEENVGPNNSMMYRVEKSNGEKVGVWGNTVLDARFKKVEIGDEVKLVYLGKDKSPKTGREYHNFDVFHRKAPMTKID